MNNKISIIIATHGDSRYLPGILHSLESQRVNLPGKNSRDETTYLWTMGEDCRHPIEVIVCSDDLFYTRQPDGLLTCALDTLKAIECPKEGGVGHHTREPGIRAATGDWVVLTNQDNYFMHGWLDMLTATMTKWPNAGMFHWDCVSNLWSWTNYKGSKLERGHIDLSCVCVRADISKHVGFPWRNYDGDYDYIEMCANLCRNQGLDIVCLGQTLSVHN